MSGVFNPASSQPEKLTMTSVRSCPIPSGSLLSRYQKSGYYSDCYSASIPATISFEQFVQAFYSTRLFRLERFILKWAISRPSTDSQLERLASGEDNQFAAWLVEEKSKNQLLLSDYRGRTRSWLMTAPCKTQTNNHTMLFFGSAIVPVTDRNTGKQRLGLIYKALLGFHKLYSVALLSAARTSLIKKNKKNSSD
ncbi:MAG: hypothetical protein HKN85_10115 [Gammaproteobacteria bacterium]|nr:hypothetical protein [Gammaproteobacteria bacterium]